MAQSDRPAATGCAPIGQVPREDVVDLLARHVAAHDAYLIAIPPSLLPAAARGLGMIREVSFFLDSAGTGDLMTAAGPGAGEAVAVTAALTQAPLVSVAVVPKTVAAVAVCAALGLADMDDARELRALQADGEPMVWPRFLVDALERVDPVTAARIEASRRALARSMRTRGKKRRG